MSQDDELPRGVVLLSFALIAMLVGGWVALAISMKMSGYPDENPMVRFRPIPVALRKFGPWTLLVPLVYFVTALIADRTKNLASCRTAFGVSIMCLAMTFLLFVCFLGSAAAPYTRGLLIQSTPAQGQSGSSSSTAH